MLPRSLQPSEGGPQHRCKVEKGLREERGDKGKETLREQSRRKKQKIQVKTQGRGGVGGGHQDG